MDNADQASFRMAEEWYALRVKVRSEKIVAAGLHGRIREVYVPVYQEKRQWSDRVKAVELPVFSGYVFGCFDVARRLPVLTIPAVMHIVGIGRTPMPIPREEIEAVRIMVDSGLPVRPWPYLRAGDSVLIEKGPLKGLEGVLVTVKGTDRLVVSVPMLQRSVAAEIERGWARPLSGAARVGGAQRLAG
jgi:transcription antitermination factor NusG